MFDDYLHLSLISQYAFCKRRASLILIENAWEENEYTTEGTLLHENVHSQGAINKYDKINIYDYPVISETLGISGKCDCIEVILDDKGYFSPLTDKKHIIYPVEYKRGTIRNEEEYNMQLCAQAMCLEEMFGCVIEKGAIFYINAHRRVEIAFVNELKQRVKEAVNALRDMLNKMHIPQSTYSAKCNKCSLYDTCMPKIKSSAHAYNCCITKEALGE
jgi:CRISPR-associated exonuclease Cas4